MRERDIEKYLVSMVRAVGGEVRKLQFIGRRGAPDRMVILPSGVLWFVELKAPGKKAQPHQVREMARLAAMRQNVMLIDSLEGVEALLA